MSSNITTPKLCKSSSRWYVYFSVNGKQRRFTGNLNRIKNLRERQASANVLINYFKDKIASGWSSDNPMTEVNYTLINALNFALEKKKEFIAKKTFHDYSNALGFVVQAIKDIKLSNLYIKDVRRLHVKLIMERMKKDRNWSSKAYNKNLGYLSAIFTELMQLSLIHI